MKKIIPFCFFLFGIGTLLNANAQTTITIGTSATTNTGNSYPCPYGNFFWGAKHDILYLASELSAQGMSTGNITSLAFNVTAIPNATNLQNYTIGMMSTNATVVSGAFASGTTTVVPASNHQVVIGWNTHTFSTPFFWDGTSNILVQVCFNNTAFTNGNPGVTFTPTGFLSTSFFRQDNTTSVCSTLNGTATTNRPNTQITFIPATIPPTAAFSANLTNTCQTTINFTDATCCNVTSWEWDFGDTTTSTLQNPTHTYAHPGTYSVQLITTNNFGVDTLLKPNYITISSGGAAPASCAPTASTPFGGFGITAVTFNTIASTSALATSSYDDLSCAWSTNVYEGSSYQLSLSATGAAGSQNFRAWIDFNNDGVFDTNTESILSVNSAASASASILIPLGAVLNTQLRLRVAADYDGSVSVPTPCGNYDFGQAEDYSVVILQNTNPPSADFTVNTVTSCSGDVVFTDLSNNSPTSWDWDFGDATTSGSQNPAHTYQASGDYTVTLIATNAFGADTLVKTTYVHVALGSAPIAATCTPTTTLHCCGYGISNVTFGTINNSSLSGIEGYKDFTCGNSTEVIEGFDNLLKIQTSAADSQDTRVWIDYNNNGTFSTNELVLTSNNHKNPSALVNVAVSTAVLNTPLRMRVWSDFAGSTPGPCNNPNRGQVEDYTVVVKPNTQPPLVHFGADITISCGGTVNFIDSTENSISSWLWDFGDLSTSTIANPTHTYTATGLYTVTLIVTNAFGADTLTKTNFINVVSTSPGPISPLCSPVTVNTCCTIGVTNVTFGTINNSSGNATEGYSDYSCLLQTSVLAGQSNTISITTSNNIAENVRVWIDYNNDGQFSSSTEIAYSDFNATLNHTGTITVPLTAVTNTPLRMRVVSDVGSALNSSCTNLTYGQAEDYGITVTPNTNPPVTAFAANLTSSCNGIIAFTNSTSNATSYTWDFGDLTNSTLANPTHTYSANGVYTVQLISCNSFGCDTVTKTNYITVTLGGPIATLCSPATTGYCCGVGISNVNLGNINNSSADGSDGYKDYTCTQRDTTMRGGYSTPFTITTGLGQSENVRIYIDYNNNGNFNSPNELVYQNNSLLTHSGNINVPATGVVFYTNLRMRVISDFNALTNACSNVTFGQAEDYTVYITNPNGTQSLSGGESVSIFPNPARGIFQINYSFSGKKDVSVSISDVLGRQVFEMQESATELYAKKVDLSNQAKGIYFVKITSENNTITQKIYLE